MAYSIVEALCARGLRAAALPLPRWRSGWGVLNRTVAPADAPAMSIPVPAMSNGHDPPVAQSRPFLERGQVPGIRTIKKQGGIGQEKAQEVTGAPASGTSQPLVGNGGSPRPCIGPGCRR